jgi:long-subunit fatty acid transport protein
MTQHWNTRSAQLVKLQLTHFAKAVRKNTFRFLILPILIIAGLVFVSAIPGQAQNLEVAGGYVHVTGDQGLDGFNLGAAWWFTPRVSVALDYDDAYDNSRLGAFDLTSVGVTAIKSHMQNFMLGPRIFFATKKIKKYKFDPFAEIQFGGTHLSQSISQVTSSTSQSASANSFTWLIGGGGDYAFNHHWSARANLDFMRTHLVDAGQSRLRLGLGVAYTFGAR